jgi:hypothetical protein
MTVPNQPQGPEAQTPPGAAGSARTIEEVQREAEAHLERLAAPTFSAAGFLAFREKITQYIADLSTESVKVSARHAADTVSAAHVEHAADFLVSSRARRLYRYYGMIGGILLGASISSFFDMTRLLQFPAGATLVAAAMGIVGAFLLALQIAKE